MTTMNRAAALALAAAIALLASLGAASAAVAAISGAVEYAYRTPYVYPNGPLAPGSALGRAAMTGSYDACPSSGGPCNWRMQSFGVFGSGCPLDPSGAPYPSGGWASAWQAGNGTVSSGEQRMTFGTPNELEIATLCLYVVHDVPGADGEAYLVAVKRIDAEPAPAPPSSSPSDPAPADTTSPTTGSSTGQPSVKASPTPLILTRALAKHTVGVRLGRTYGSWRKGSRRRVTCKKATASTYTCAATWRYKATTKKARLTVRIKRNTAVARYI